ncbi:MAG: integration host factor subunit alpha [Pseudomonadota bacterium]
MALTKKDIVEQLHTKTGFPRQIMSQIVTAIFDTVKDDLLKGNNVKITNFGVLKVRNKKARPGRNMQTGDAMEVCARSVVTFKASRALRDGLNR